MANEANKMMMDSWSDWTKQTIQSDAFTAASGAFMDWSLATHKMMNELSGQFMESMDVPRRSDLARISSQVQSVETRILEHEEAQDNIKDLLATIVNKLDNLEQAQQAVAKNGTVAKSEPVAAKTATAVAKQEEPAEKAPSKAKSKATKSATKTASKAKKTTARTKKSKAKKASKSK